MAISFIIIIITYTDGSSGAQPPRNWLVGSPFLILYKTILSNAVNWDIAITATEFMIIMLLTIKLNRKLCKNQEKDERDLCCLSNWTGDYICGAIYI